MKIICVCGLGMGSSLILKMTMEKAMKKLGKQCVIEHWDAGTIGSQQADVIVAAEDFREKLSDRQNVVFVQNIINTEEVTEKMREYLEKNNLL